MNTSRRQQVGEDAIENTPLQQQLDAIIAQGRSQLPVDLVRQLVSPIEDLITSGAAEQALKEGEISYASNRCRYQ